MDCVGYASIVLFLSFITVIPICAWSTHTIYKSIQTSDAFMMARKPKLSFALLCANLFDVSIIQPLYCILLITLDLKQLNKTLIASLTDLRFIVFGSCFVARMWLLNFDHFYHKECVRLLWHRNNEDNFYLRYRTSLGNVSFVIKCTIIACLTCLLLLFSPLILGHFVDSETILSVSLRNVCRTILFSIEAVLLWILYCKINRIDDKFGIKKEILFIALCPGFCASIYYVTHSFNIIAPFIIDTECTQFYVYSFFMLGIMSSTIFLKTVIPIHFRSNEEHEHTMKLMEIGHNTNAVCFEDVLGSRSALLLFVEHLESEFSVENILFLVEVAKFREYYLSVVLDKPEYQLLFKPGISINSTLCLTMSKSIESPDGYSPTHTSSPISSPTSDPNIVTEKQKYSLLIDFEAVQEFIINDFELDMNISEFVRPLLANFIPVPTEYNSCTVVQTARNIFDHFVDNGSMHMINISSQCRSNIQETIENIFASHYKDLSTIFVFDAAFSEIYSMIVSDPFIRFKMGDKFNDFLKNGHLTEMNSYHIHCTSTATFGQSYSDIRQSLKNYAKNEVMASELTTIQSERSTQEPQIS